MKKASLETNRDGQKKSRKCLVLRVLAAKRKRPAVVEFTAGRETLGGGGLLEPPTHKSLRLGSVKWWSVYNKANPVDFAVRLNG